MTNYLPEIMVFVWGLCIGSFLNVCIWRLPQESMSLVSPLTSICPKCQHPLLFRDNIPVLSYLWLKGHCRFCDTSISARYPIVELLTGFFALCLYAKYRISWEMLIYGMLVASLLIITFIDLDHQIIPDVITLPGMIIGFIAACFVLPNMDWKSSLIGFMLGGGLFYTIALLYSVIRKTEGMGGGDIKLLAMLGTIFGIKGILFIVFVSSALGTVIGLIIFFSSKNRSSLLKIPFGPFLAIAALLYLFWGHDLIYWYFSLYH